jgi:UDP-glucose 4-epimerase
LITGGLGYLGGRLVNHFSNAGFSVLIGSRSEIPAPIWSPNSKVLKLEWANEDNLLEACNNVDVVIHAAGMNAHACEVNPTEAAEFNGEATYRLAQASIRAKVQTFIYLSTAQVYSSPLLAHITEATEPKNPHPYATSNLAGEVAVLSAVQKTQTNATVLRLSNVFGTPMHLGVNCWDLFVNDICKQAVLTREIVIMSDENQSRDFITISDACNVIKSITSAAFLKKTPKILNVGNGLSISLVDMAKIVQERSKLVLGFKPPIRTMISPSSLPIPFEFQTLHSTFLKGLMSRNHEDEIDDLLKYCKENFTG